MGLAIGEGPAQLLGARALGSAAAQPRDVRPRLNTPAALSRTANEDQPGDFFARPEREVPRAGFGDGTVSAPVAAVNALAEGFREVRPLIPSPEERREELRANLDEQQQALEARRTRRREEQARTEQTQARVERIGNPTLEARRFINALNETVATTQARLAGEEPPRDPNTQATLRVNGETFPFNRPVPIEPGNRINFTV